MKTEAARHFDRYCIACRHALRGLTSNTCPECGRAFDPEDLHTTSAYPVSAGWHSIAKGASFLTSTAAVAAAVIFLLSAMGWLWSMEWWFVLLFMSAPVWLGMVIVAFAVALAPRAPLRLRTRIVALLALPLIVSIVLTNWPFRSNFFVHRPLLDSIAARAQAGETLSVPMQVGLFRIQEVRVGDRGEVILQISGDDSGGNHLVKSAKTVATLRNQDWWQRVLDDEWSTYYED